jgi:hypothetical protein
MNRDNTWLSDMREEEKEKELLCLGAMLIPNLLGGGNRRIMVQRQPGQRSRQNFISKNNPSYTAGKSNMFEASLSKNVRPYLTNI